MARPTKQGIDYYPLDVQFDDKIELFIVENGPASLSVLITVWQLIYQNEGYYIKYSNDLFLLIKRRILLDVEEVKRCVDAAVARGLFCNTIFKKHKILTSGAIQNRYFIASRKKKIVSVVKNYICNGVSDAVNPNVVWVDVAGNATKEKEKGKEKENTASGDADKVDEVFYLSKKKKKLKGDVLRDFLLFWDAFDYKKGKAEAADAFRSVYIPKVLPQIIEGAEREAKGRDSLLRSNKTPKMAEGWLSGRRWEDQEVNCEEDEWR